MTYEFNKEAEGFSLAIDGNPAESFINVLIAKSETSTHLAMRIQDSVININVVDDTITIDGDDFSGTPGELWTALTENIFDEQQGGAIPENIAVTDEDNSFSTPQTVKGDNGNILVVEATDQVAGVRFKTDAAHANARDWGIYTNYNDWGDLVIRLGNEKGFDPYNLSAAKTILSITRAGLLELNGASSGLTIRSANNTAYRITVENDGTLTTTAV